MSVKCNKNFKNINDRLCKKYFLNSLYLVYYFLDIFKAGGA